MNDEMYFLELWRECADGYVELRCIDCIVPEEICKKLYKELDEDY